MPETPGAGMAFEGRGVHTVAVTPFLFLIFFDNVEHQHKGSPCTRSIHGDLARTEEQRRSTAVLGCRASMLDTNTVINA
jgi:hypothetical protein